MTEVEVHKLYGLSHTRMTMHERFSLLLGKPVVWRGKRNPYSARTRSQTMNPEFIMALAHQLENLAEKPVRRSLPRGRGRGRGGLQRAGSEGSLRGLPGFRRSNSFGNINQASKNQSWRQSNGNLSFPISLNGSVYGGAGSEKSWGSRRGRGARGGGRGARGGGRGARGGGRGRGFRGRTHQGRVTRVDVTGEGAAARPARGAGRGAGVAARPARGVGRRGARRNPAGAPAPRGRGFARQRGRGRGRGGVLRNQTKSVPTKEQLDAQLDQYMSGTKAALDKELDEYMRHAMDFD